MAIRYYNIARIKYLISQGLRELAHKVFPIRNAGLKRCWNCGGVNFSSDYEDGGTWVTCKTCGWCGDWNSWNDRPIERSMEKRISALEKENHEQMMECERLRDILHKNGLYNQAFPEE